MENELKKETKIFELDTELSRFEPVLSTRTYKRLNMADIRTLGDLISKTPDDLLSLWSFGKTSLIEVETFLEQMGYSLKNVQPLKKIDEQKVVAVNNETRIDDLNTSLKEFKDKISARAYNLLRREGINTINDLIIKPISVIGQIHNMGSVTLNEIIDFVYSLGLTFAKEENEIQELENKIENEQKEQSEITSRIALKEKLLKRYNYLTFEKEKLLKQEQELDEQIKIALENLKSLGVKDEQKVK